MCLQVHNMSLHALLLLCTAAAPACCYHCARVQAAGDQILVSFQLLADSIRGITPQYRPRTAAAPAYSCDYCSLYSCCTQNTSMLQQIGTNLRPTCVQRVQPTLCPRNVPIQSPLVPDRSMGVASLLALTRK